MTLLLAFLSLSMSIEINIGSRGYEEGIKFRVIDNCGSEKLKFRF